MRIMKLKTLRFLSVDLGAFLSNRNFGDTCSDSRLFRNAVAYCSVGLLATNFLEALSTVAARRQVTPLIASLLREASNAFVNCP